MTATLEQRLSDLAESAGLNAPIGAMAWAAYAGEEELQRVVASGADGGRADVAAPELGTALNPFDKPSPRSK